MKTITPAVILWRSPWIARKITEMKVWSKLHYHIGARFPTSPLLFLEYMVSGPRPRHPRPHAVPNGPTPCWSRQLVSIWSVPINKCNRFSNPLVIFASFISTGVISQEELLCISFCIQRCITIQWCRSAETKVALETVTGIIQVLNDSTYEEHNGNGNNKTRGDRIEYKNYCNMIQEEAKVFLMPWVLLW